MVLAARCHEYLLRSQQLLTAALPAVSQATAGALHRLLTCRQWMTRILIPDPAAAAAAAACAASSPTKPQHRHPWNNWHLALPLLRFIHNILTRKSFDLSAKTDKQTNPKARQDSIFGMDLNVLPYTSRQSLHFHTTLPKKRQGQKHHNASSVHKGDCGRSDLSPLDLKYQFVSRALPASETITSVFMYISDMKWAD